jgi:hypothetical protein
MHIRILKVFICELCLQCCYERTRRVLFASWPNKRSRGRVVTETYIKLNYGITWTWSGLCTCEVLDILMLTRMFSTCRVIPLNTQPLSLGPFYLAMVTNSAKLAVEGESLADVEGRVGRHVFRLEKSNAICSFVCLDRVRNSQAACLEGTSLW